MHTMGVGAIPRSLTVILMDDIVDSVKPGDDVTVTGIVRMLLHFHDVNFA